MENQQRWQDWINLILGVWVFLSPFFGIGAIGVAAWNAWIFGIVVAVVSIWALSQPQMWEEWINMVVGVWLIISPFVLGYTEFTGAMWNHIVVGLVVGGDALWAMLRQPVLQRPV